MSCKATRLHRLSWWLRGGPNLACLAVVLAMALGSCAPRRPVGRRGAEPILRVALVADVNEVRVRGQGGVVVNGGAEFSLAPGEEVVVAAAGDGVSVENRSGPSRRVTFASRSTNEFLVVNGRAYRGGVEVIRGGEGVTAVNVVGTEEYLLGVVSAEMGRQTRRELTALEAQAIASRTYALKNRGRFRANGYDLRAGVSDQLYMGLERETQLGGEAVRATAGRVVTYGGELISAFFHSTCGYSTASPEEAFRTVRATPYLQPVSDRRPSGGYYCDMSPRFRWTVEWDGVELLDILRRTVPPLLGIDAAELEHVRNVRVHGVGPSRRVTELRLAVQNGDIPVYGPDLRRVFRTPEDQMLGSNAIEVVTTPGEAGLESLKVMGAGWGHGVGMCQWGAIGRSRAGQSAREILMTYFPGTRIEIIY